MRRFAFLFGSGISIKAGLPGCAEITEAIMTGSRKIKNETSSSVERVCYYTDESFFFSKQSKDKSSCELIKLIIRLLSKIKNEVDKYYGDRRISNYEDIYYVLFQIEGSMTREYDNPAVVALARKLEISFAKVEYSAWTVVGNFPDLLSKACDYVKDVVTLMLQSKEADAQYLEWIVRACSEKKDKPSFLFILNHDVLLERLLSENKIHFTDGFKRTQKDGRKIWDSSLFSESKGHVPYIKLHGSIDWFRKLSSRPEEKTVPFKVTDYSKIKRCDLSRPLFLLGTHNKPIEYTNNLYEDLHHQLYLCLRQVTCLVICGYSFNDKGINSRLIHWMSSSSRNRIVLIHGDPQKCIENARGAIGREWFHWNYPRVKTMNVWAENVVWSKLLKKLT